MEEYKYNLKNILSFIKKYYFLDFFIFFSIKQEFFYAKKKFHKYLSFFKGIIIIYITTTSFV